MAEMMALMPSSEFVEWEAELSLEDEERQKAQQGPEDPLHARARHLQGL